MKSLHLTIMIFCHVLLASVVLYVNTFAAASPLSGSPIAPPETNPVKPVVQKPVPVPEEPIKSQNADLVAKASPIEQGPPSSPVVIVPKEVVPQHSVPVVEQPKIVAPSVPVVPVLTERKIPEIVPQAVSKVNAAPAPVVIRDVPAAIKQESVPNVVAASPKEPVVEAKKADLEAKKDSILEPVKIQQAPVIKVEEPVQVPHKDKQPVAAALVAESPVVKKSAIIEAISKPEAVPMAPIAEKVMKSVPVVEQPVSSKSQQPEVKDPVVKGGLGPLQLLAATLCNYQPEKLVGDETLNELYRRRATVRKSLFEFMSLKFTNLEKLSSRLNSGLAVMPIKTVDPNKSSVIPSHGWPVVGICTAHDLKLMGEAAWCECNSGDANCPTTTTVAPTLHPPVAVSSSDEEAPKITSNQHMNRAARTFDKSQPKANAPVEPSSVISKILHVNDVRDAPVVESSITTLSLNLTQQQLATIQAQATSTQECRRNALRYTKVLFNHLAEDQKNLSESWPRLYSMISEDECARKRMIDIITALSGFRSDTTSIRRDNIEFAFAMDDLRAKVLENEVNVPLTFDKQFIEVEQFLQQSVQLMLANIDPQRAKITKMRYRSLMSGPSASDDQCIELHQRLLAKNYPTDCNPTQFGQLPDVLRMTASSLELWSIEKELAQRSARIYDKGQQQQPVRILDHPTNLSIQPQMNKESVNECIANLVAN